ncbi:MAG: DUF2281 domain-containing protein [Planctomycetota bacterium]
MTIREKLIQELSTLPDALVAELLEHARVLRGKNGKGSRETAIASEPSLSRDWLRLEEDEAWKDL